MGHITVLKKEAVDGLALSERSLVVDATYGVGGHSKAILSQLGQKGRLISIDADEDSFRAHPVSDERQVAVVDNFRNIAAILEGQKVESPDAILADLGWRTDQFETGGKGFSFSSDEPLLMTFGNPEAYVFTAYDVVNDWDEENLADIIYAYGEERFSRRIARAILEAREIAPLKTAAQLAEVVASAVPKRAHSRLHPATKTFQAIRIVVNDELGALEQLLNDGYERLTTKGRMAIISFHSLEDRIVKRKFRTLAHDHGATLITKKPLIPSEEELQENPRARSAKLRIIQK